MPVKITLDIFSGRPNPYFTISDSAARQFLDKLSFGRFNKITDKSDPFPTSLGFRGLLLEQGAKKANADLPARVYITYDAVFAEDKIAKGDMGTPISSFIFDNLQSLKEADDIPSLKKHLQRLIDEFAKQRFDYIRNHHKYYVTTLREFHGPIRRVACACSPVPDLDAWNSDPFIQSQNNCYNYSTNYRTDTYGQPGMAAGQQYNDLSACTVPAGKISAKMGAVADGLIDLPSNNNKCPGTGHLVALVISPNWDYHWYRKGRNGKWSHKMGGTPASILDNSGNPISDPRTADRGSYVDFCTFMQVIHGHFKVEGPF